MLPSLSAVAELVVGELPYARALARSEIPKPKGSPSLAQDRKCRGLNKYQCYGPIFLIQLYYHVPQRDLKIMVAIPARHIASNGPKPNL